MAGLSLDAARAILLKSKRRYWQQVKLESMKQDAIDALKESIDNRNWIGSIAWKEELDKIESKLMKLRKKNLS